MQKLRTKKLKNKFCFKRCIVTLYFFYLRPIFPIKKHFQFCNNGITDVFHFPNVIAVCCKNGGKFGSSEITIILFAKKCI